MTALSIRSLATTLLVLCGVQSTAASESYKWVQYAPGGLEARVVTDASACPDAMVDGQEAKMTQRSAPGTGYPIRSCVLPIPKGTKLLTVDRVPLPLPKEQPNRILIVGDTGCRLKGAQVQACNDMSQWPFRLGAAMSADFKPDLVIHVGDMHYRETDCPTGNLGCAGTPFGDIWQVWKEDFFDPAQTLLKSAPWVMVRGNHEECERGGKGWARTLDPYPFDLNSGASGCLGPQAPYTVDIGGVTILVMDVSTADEKQNQKQADFYRPQFESASAIKGPVWYAFHRPIWAAESLSNGEIDGANKTLALAAEGHMPANAMAILSGHHHVFEVMKYEQDLPVQIVSGHGGDDLSIKAPKDVKGLVINKVKIADGISRPGVFGFSMIERDQADATGKKWTLTGYDVRGRGIGTCHLDGREISCK